MAVCCRFQTFLIFCQIFLGLATTGLTVYLYMFVPVLSLRDKPFWAGIPLLLAGLTATSFLGQSKNTDGAASSCKFVFKIISVIMTVISVFTCVTSLVFASLHVYKLFTYSHCQHLTNGCVCFDHQSQSLENTDDGHFYTPVRDCHIVYCEIKIYICSMGALCVLSSICAISFIISVWNSAYGATSSSPSASTSPPAQNALTSLAEV